MEKWEEHRAGSVPEMGPGEPPGLAVGSARWLLPGQCGLLSVPDFLHRDKHARLLPAAPAGQRQPPVPEHRGQAATDPAGVTHPVPAVTHHSGTRAPLHLGHLLPLPEVCGIRAGLGFRCTPTPCPRPRRRSSDLNQNPDSSRCVCSLFPSWLVSIRASRPFPFWKQLLRALRLTT
jgi:hypothetical protein